MEEHPRQEEAPERTTTASGSGKPAPSSLLHRVLLLAVFLLLLPLFPPEAPEFLHHTPLTASWELVHLLLVGIIVSYGLCSRRNPDGESTGKPPFDLQVASVFDDDDRDGEEAEFTAARKTHMWNSTYIRGEPKVVLAGEPGGGDSSGSSGGVKPLCLPVRSLRSQLPGEDKPKKVEEEEDESRDVARPSPIPWRTRSARIEAELERWSPPHSPVLNRVPSASHSPSESPDLGGNGSHEDGLLVRRSYQKPSSSAPPAPPPPPPPRPIPASRRSLRPSLKSQRNRLPKDPLEESDKSAPGHPKQEQSPLLVLPPARKINTRKKPPRRNVSSSRKFIIDSDDDASRASAEESSSDASSSVTEAEAEGEGEGNEVDKKADEFIAKFREQMRLQRIESIKRSAGLRKRAK